MGLDINIYTKPVYMSKAYHFLSCMSAYDAIKKKEYNNFKDAYMYGKYIIETMGELRFTKRDLKIIYHIAQGTKNKEWAEPISWRRGDEEKDKEHWALFKKIVDEASETSYTIVSWF